MSKFVEFGINAAALYYAPAVVVGFTVANEVNDFRRQVVGNFGC